MTMVLIEKESSYFHRRTVIKGHAHILYFYPISSERLFRKWHPDDKIAWRSVLPTFLYPESSLPSWLRGDRYYRVRYILCNAIKLRDEDATTQVIIRIRVGFYDNDKLTITWKNKSKIIKGRKTEPTTLWINFKKKMKREFLKSSLDRMWCDVLACKMVNMIK